MGQLKKIIIEALRIIPIVFCLVLPLHQLASSTVLVAWLLLVLLGPKKIDIPSGKLFFLPLLFGCYAVGIFFSWNQDFSILGRKLSLIVFPLIFVLSKINKEQKERMLKFFVYGLFMACIFCLIRALAMSIGYENNAFYFRANVQEQKSFFESILYGGNYFFGSHLSYFHQTVYFSLYLCTGTLILLNDKSNFAGKIKFTLLFLFATVIFLLSNKGGILCLVLVVSYHLIIKAESIGKKSVVLLATALIGLLVFKLNPRFGLSLAKIQKDGLVLEKSARYDYATRLLSWDASLKAIAASPLLGYGPGDTQENLNRIYRSNGYSEPLKRNLNSHNQYLQLWLELGLIGLTLFLLLMVLLFRSGLNSQNRSTLVMGIFLCLLITGLFESYFNRYSGLVFFCFWWCLTMTTTKHIANED